MDSIWATKIQLIPTGPLTFRRMPSGILHIMSYPFMPPTTMSGFLQRLLDIAEGGDWQGYGSDWYGKGPGKEFTLTLDPEYRPLGAFPAYENWTIHKTRRHGPKAFKKKKGKKHVEFSELFRKNHEENYQLHHWDYLFCEQLTGWVAAREKAPLTRLHLLQNYGGKAGKEGWLFVAEVSKPRQLVLKQGDFTPLGLITAPLRPDSGRFFNLYGHHWSRSYEWGNGQKGGVDGFTQFGVWWGASEVSGPYWALEEGLGFQAHLPDRFLAGEREPFFSDRQTTPRTGEPS